MDLLPVTVTGFFRMKPANLRYLDPAAPHGLVVHPPIPNAPAREMSYVEILRKVRTQIAGDYRP